MREGSRQLFFKLVFQFFQTNIKTLQDAFSHLLEGTGCGLGLKSTHPKNPQNQQLILGFLPSF